MNKLGKTLKSFYLDKVQTKRITGNVVELYNPILEWPDWLFARNIHQVITANQENCLHAASIFGKIDLIHAHVSFPAGFVAMKLATRLGVPYLITEHMGPFPFPELLSNGKLKKKIEAPLRNATATIAVSPALCETIAAYGVPKPTYIPNLVDERFFMPKSVQQEKTGPMIFFALAAMIPQKGIPDLLKGFHRATETNKNILLRIGGGGEYFLQYQNLAKQFAIAKKTVWLGPLSRTQVRKEMQDCHCFVLTSHYETFGVVLAEATACGKPIIATKCGGPECIVTSGNGLLVEKGDTESIANALLYMAMNLSKYKRDVIRQEFLDRFSRQVVVGQILDVYRSCLCKPSGS